MLLIKLRIEIISAKLTEVNYKTKLKTNPITFARPNICGCSHLRVLIANLVNKLNPQMGKR